MARLVQAVERLAGLAQRDAGLPVLQRALAEELVALVDADQAHVVMLAGGRPSHGRLADRDGRGEEYVLAPDGDTGALGWVGTTGQVALVPDARVRGALPPELVREHGLRSAALLPLEADGTTRAVVLLGSRSARLWPAGAIGAARALAEIAGAGIAVRDARLAASIDPLTGCLNHGAMLTRLNEEVARARRQGTALALMILDLDDFKRVNDTYGHPTGDALLRHVGEALRHEYRSFDQVARYGGDEFVVILPNVRGDRADAAAARAVRILRGIHIARDDGVHEQITVSAGVAEWADPETAGELLERADTALRETKAGGKDGLVRAASPAIGRIA